MRGAVLDVRDDVFALTFGLFKATTVSDHVPKAHSASADGAYATASCAGQSRRRSIRENCRNVRSGCLPNGLHLRGENTSMAREVFAWSRHSGRQAFKDFASGLVVGRGAMPASRL
jgi:hypothetical protein